MQRLNIIDKIVLTANELQVISAITANEIKNFYTRHFGDGYKVIVLVA